MKSQILKKVTLILEVLIILFLFSISIFSIMSSKNNGLARTPITGLSLLPIHSDSMLPEFGTGDLVIGKKIKDISSLRKGDIITYKTSDYTGIDHITHRIVNNPEVDGYIMTQGDNTEMSKIAVKIAEEDIECIIVNEIDNVGKFFIFFEDPKNYAICIVIPLVLLFIWNVYAFVKMLVDLKRKKQIETAVNGGEVSDELKEIALREYLARQKELQENGANKIEAAPTEVENKTE